MTNTELDLQVQLPREILYKISKVLLAKWLLPEL